MKGTEVFARVATALQVAIKDEMQRIPTELEIYFSDFMHSPSEKNFKVSKSGRKRALKNETDKLYILSGALRKALKPKGAGNVSKVSFDGGRFVLSYGIDLDVIPYARIHELGGTAGHGAKIKPRAYLTPAIKAFFEKEMKAKAERVVQKAIAAAN